METQTEGGSLGREGGREGVKEGGLLRFLERAESLVIDALEENDQSHAFDGSQEWGQGGGDDAFNGGLDGGREGGKEGEYYWNSLTVDLEKHKVVFPQWALGKGLYHPGVVAKCVITRNKVTE